MPDPNPAQTLVKLAVKFIEYQGKRVIGEGFANEVLKTLTEYAGEDATARLAAFFDQGARAEQLVAAFKDADAAFAQTIGDDNLARGIRQLPLARLESLEKLADALPRTLDDAALLAALRARFAEDYPHLTDAQLDNAARVYRDGLDRALAAKCGQLLPTLFRKIERIDWTTSETLARVKRIETRVTGAAWRRPSAPRADPGFVGRRKELDDVRTLLTPGARTVITATIHGSPGIGKTFLARQLAAQLDPEFPRGVIFQKLGSGHRAADQCTPLLDEWARNTGYPLARDEHISPDALRGWLAGDGAMLIVLDDIWNVAAVQPLLDAAPPNGDRSPVGEIAQTA